MSNPLVVNPTTGFLESPSDQNSVALSMTYFDSDKKLEFLRLIDECIKLKEYPNLADISGRVGISQRNFEKHLHIDPVFSAEWQERKARLRSVFTVELGHKAMSKMGTLANLAMLRYLESGTWLPETRINHVTDHSSAKSAVNSLIEVHDAEIVPNSGDIPASSPTQGDAAK